MLLSAQNQNTLTVSQLIDQVKNTLETRYQAVRVLGEIRSFKPWRSGHWYFDVKDEHALIPAVMFKAQCAKVPFEVLEGMQVVAVGRVSVYAPQSKMQFLVEALEPVGQGLLALKFEELKARLLKEGLFDKTHKKTLPPYPTQIGIITSPQGAVLHDFVQVLKARNPKINVLLCPTRVQGPGAHLEIIEALNRLQNQCEVIILARGGGSLEDLWAFNEEALARALYACQIPIISAIGHETDFTICDFVADIRAATPTHAAQIVAKPLADIENMLLACHNRLGFALKRQAQGLSLRLLRLSKRLPTPLILLKKAEQELRLKEIHMEQAFKWQLNKSQEKLNLYTQKLHALSPLNVLKRGYSLVEDEQGHVIDGQKNLTHNQRILLHFQDGFTKALIQKEPT